MGGSWTLFSSGRFILPSMKPFILVCGGVLVLAGLAIADDYSNYYDAGEDDAEWEYDEDLDVDMEGRKASAKGKCVTKPNLNQQCLQNTPKTRTVLVGGILQRTTAPAARKVQTPCSVAGQCRNTATRSLTRDVLESVTMPTLSLVKDSLVKMIQQALSVLGVQ